MPDVDMLSFLLNHLGFSVFVGMAAQLINCELIWDYNEFIPGLYIACVFIIGEPPYSG